MNDSHFSAYLAGVIDSDGAIGISKRREKTNSHGYSYREIIQITWKKSPETFYLVNKLKSIYGGSVGEYVGGFDKTTTTVRYSADGKTAEKIAQDVLPYLVLKRHRAELLIEMRGIKGVRYGNGNRKPDAIWAAEEEIYQRAVIQRRLFVS